MQENENFQFVEMAAKLRFHSNDLAMCGASRARCFGKSHISYKVVERNKKL